MKVMKKIYREPTLEIVKFSIEERIMGNDGEFPSVDAGASGDPNPFEDDTF